MIPKPVNANTLGGDLVYGVDEEATLAPVE
jgi:hypothetical protein